MSNVDGKRHFFQLVCCQVLKIGIRRNEFQQVFVVREYQSPWYFVFRSCFVVIWFPCGVVAFAFVIGFSFSAIVCVFVFLPIVGEKGRPKVELLGGFGCIALVLPGNIHFRNKQMGSDQKVQSNKAEYYQNESRGNQPPQPTPSSISLEWVLDRRCRQGSFPLRLGIVTPILHSVTTLAVYSSVVPRDQRLARHGSSRWQALWFVI
mmetsp:Transcript_13469/g.33889  ORF Transcript_13469/g.33889 Transcript_13469/m.33889 type:complete len:206 (+) Transcript_13469:3621-4238(+)